MAQSTFYERVQPPIALRYNGSGSAPDDYEEGGDMELSDRLHEAEKDLLRLKGAQAQHEEVCAMRYEAIKSGNDRIAGYIKWLAITVGALAFVVLGVATVHDITRAMANRVGVQIYNPGQPQAPR